MGLEGLPQRTPTTYHPNKITIEVTRFKKPSWWKFWDSTTKYHLSLTITQITTQGNIGGDSSQEPRDLLSIRTEIKRNETPVTNSIDGVKIFDFATASLTPRETLEEPELRRRIQELEQDYHANELLAEAHKRLKRYMK